MAPLNAFQHCSPIARPVNARLLRRAIVLALEEARRFTSSEPRTAAPSQARPPVPRKEGFCGTRRTCCTYMQVLTLRKLCRCVQYLDLVWVFPEVPSIDPISLRPRFHVGGRTVRCSGDCFRRPSAARLQWCPAFNHRDPSDRFWMQAERPLDAIG